MGIDKPDTAADKPTRPAPLLAEPAQLMSRLEETSAADEQGYVGGGEAAVSTASRSNGNDKGTSAINSASEARAERNQPPAVDGSGSIGKTVTDVQQAASDANTRLKETFTLERWHGLAGETRNVAGAHLAPVRPDETGRPAPKVSAVAVVEGPAVTLERPTGERPPGVDAARASGLRETDPTEGIGGTNGASKTRAGPRTPTGVQKNDGTLALEESRRETDTRRETDEGSDRTATDASAARDDTARLAGADRVRIDLRKVTGYALNPDHPVGGNKARVFESVLGFNRTNAHDLIAQIRQGVMENIATPGKVDDYGYRFTVDIPVTGPRGSGIVRTAWIVRAGSATPSLTTLFVP